MAGPISTKTTKDKAAADAGRISVEPDPLSTPNGLYGGILGLQHAAGNQAVNDLFQSNIGGSTQVDNDEPSIVQVALWNGKGHPLDPNLRTFMEAGFDQDFSQVKVHNDTNAAKSAHKLDAAALTIGDHIILGNGRYKPNTIRGKHLLAHELAHVLQQRQNSNNYVAAETAEEEANQSAEQVVRGMPTSVQSTTQIGVQRQTTEKESEIVSKPGGEVEKGPAVGVGFQAWNIFKHHVNISPAVELGPVRWSGFSFEGEANPQVGKFRENSNTPASKGENRSESEELESPTQIRVGKVTEKSVHGTGYGVQAEIEHAFERKIEALGMGFKPKLKGGGKLTNEGAEIGMEGKLSGELFSGGVKFTFAEIDWEKGEFEFNKATWFIEMQSTITLDELREYLPVERLGGLNAAFEVKITFGFEFKPNYLWQGWRSLIAEASQAIRAGATAMSRVLIVAETGELTAIGVGSVASAAAIAYVAWIAYGFYQLEMSHQKGARTGALEQFLDGYANMLTLLTEPTGLLDWRVRNEIIEHNLISLPWEETMKEYMEAYIHDEIMLLPRSMVYIAGEAAIAQDVDRYIREKGKDGWLLLAKSLRQRLGENPLERARKIRETLRSQLASGANAIGIPFE